MISPESKEDIQAWELKFLVARSLEHSWLAINETTNMTDENNKPPTNIDRTTSGSITTVLSTRVFNYCPSPLILPP